MAYHGIRPSSSSKQQKNDRLSEMSMQEQLIEKKKREIETKLAEQKRKEEEEALRKLQLKAKALAAAEENRAAMTAARQSARAMLNTKSPIGTIQNMPNMPNNVNKFSNDGSFMDQFKNLQGVKMKFPPQGCGYQPGASGSHGGNSNVLSMKLVNRNVQPTGLPVAKLSVFEDDDDEEADSRVSPAEDPPKPKVKVEREAQQLMYTVPEVRDTVVKMEPLEMPQHRFTYEDPTMFNSYMPPQRMLQPYEIKRPVDEASYSYQNFCSGQLPGSMEGGPSAPKKPRRSRWAPDDQKVVLPPPVAVVQQPTMNCTAPIGTDTTLIAYALKVFGTVELTQDHWKQLNDQLKMKALFEQLLAKKRAADRLARAGKNKYEYDSDEEQDGGTWEHKRRMEEMDKTKVMAEILTEMGRGKHHIGDFLPPDELERFMEKYDAIKNGRDPDLSDYKEFKIKEDNIGFKMLQKLGWEEGKGLGSDGSGITQPVNKAAAPVENSGLGQEKPADLQQGDDEYEAYRKRMMLAYRFRPNPLNNPRRPYY